MKILYRRLAKVYSCVNYFDSGHYTSRCHFYKGRVIRSIFEVEGGYTDSDWTKKGYKSDPWKGNTWRNLHSSGFDMDNPKDVTIYVDERDVEYKRVVPAYIPSGLYINVEYVWSEVGGTQECFEDDVKVLG